MLEQQEKSLILKPEINYPTDETLPLVWPTQICKPSSLQALIFKKITDSLWEMYIPEIQKKS